MQTNQENSWQPDSSWLHLLLANIRIVVFLVASLVGMLLVYWYFSPEEATAEIIAATTQGRLAAPIYKAVPEQPVLQRLAQSPGPLRIGLIAGHKGNDSGAVCADGLTEAQINENIANLVAAQLQADGIPVDILDEFDPRLPRYGATAVVSIHADSCVYYHDQLTGFKIAGSSYTNSSALEACVEQEYGRATNLPYHPHTISEDMTDYHTFRDLPLGVPAIIIEVGFMYLDREILTNRPHEPAGGIASGIQCYLAQLGVR